MIKPGAILICSLQLCLVSCRAQVPGCTDPLANNYNPSATLNDGSCTYDPFAISPQNTFKLSDQISGTSGLLLWNGNIWTQNNYADVNLYGLDTINADIEHIYTIEGVENLDWEEISQDQEYIYIGDFGNNGSGNRKDLNILRVEKNSLKIGTPHIDTIWFSYEDQVDFTPMDPNQTDFDCEAFIVSNDSIYLFTKQWINTQTSIYTLPKTPGTYKALKKVTHDVEGLITGATFLESKRLIVLCGYTGLLHPFLYLIYDYSGMDFFTGNKRRVTVSLPFHQVEGITTKDGLKYYLSNESFVYQPFVNTSQKLHIFYLDELLQDYLILSLASNDTIFDRSKIYPNPAKDYIVISIHKESDLLSFEVFDIYARIVMKGALSNELSLVDIGHLTPGRYFIRFIDKNNLILHFLKL